MSSADLEMTLAQKKLEQQKNNMLDQVIRKSEGDDSNEQFQAEENEEVNAEENLLETTEAESEEEKKEEQNPKPKTSFTAKAGKFLAGIPKGINKIVGSMKGAASTSNEATTAVTDVDRAADEAGNIAE